MTQRFFLTPLLSLLIVPIAANVASARPNCEEQVLRRIAMSVTEAQERKLAVESHSDRILTLLMTRGRQAVSDINREIEALTEQQELALRRCARQEKRTCPTARRLSVAINILERTEKALADGVVAAIEALLERTEMALEPIDSMIERGTEHIRECLES